MACVGKMLKRSFFFKACVVRCRLEKLAYTIQFDEGVERVVGNTDADCGEGRRGVFFFK